MSVALPNILKINKHSLDGSDASGNGHHGHCKHCGLPYVSDLGYDSWEGTKCVDRDRTINFDDFPDEMRSYANFNSLIFDQKRQLFIRPYGKNYTYNQLVKIINKLKNGTADRKTKNTATTA